MEPSLDPTGSEQGRGGREPEADGRPARRTGPLVLILPLLFFVAGALFLAGRAPELEPTPPPLIADPEEAVQGLAGELEARDGSRLAAWLAPLHADPGRQAFESEALRRRLGLGPGEPWRLVLRWEAPSREGDTPAAAGSRRSGAFGGSGPARGESAPPEPLSLGLGPVEVSDERGTALASLDPLDPSAEAPPGVADPLRTLFGPPAGSLRPGQAAEWVLWGREPGEGARLEGLLPRPDGRPDPAGADPEALELGFAAATGLVGPLRLAPVPLRRRDLLLPLARLEREPEPTPGKKAVLAPSEGRDGSRR